MRTKQESDEKNKRTKRSTLLYLPAISSILSHFLSHHPFSLSIIGTSLTWFGINPVLLFESQAFNSCFVINILSSLLRAGWTATIRPQLSNHGPSIELKRENEKMRKWVNRVLFIHSANMGTLRFKVLDTKLRIQDPRSIISSMITKKLSASLIKRIKWKRRKRGKRKKQDSNYSTVPLAVMIIMKWLKSDHNSK